MFFFFHSFSSSLYKYISWTNWTLTKKKIQRKILFSNIILKPCALGRTIFSSVLVCFSLAQLKFSTPCNSDMCCFSCWTSARPIRVCFLFHKFAHTIPQRTNICIDLFLFIQFILFWNNLKHFCFSWVFFRIGNWLQAPNTYLRRLAE